MRTQIRLRMSKPVIIAGFEGSTEVGSSKMAARCAWICLDPTFGPLPALYRVLQAPHSQQ